jgi:hypothetical protein
MLLSLGSKKPAEGTVTDLGYPDKSGGVVMNINNAI